MWREISASLLCFTPQNCSESFVIEHFLFCLGARCRSGSRRFSLVGLGSARFSFYLDVGPLTLLRIDVGLVYVYAYGQFEVLCHHYSTMRCRIVFASGVQLTRSSACFVRGHFLTEVFCVAALCQIMMGSILPSLVRTYAMFLRHY